MNEMKFSPITEMRFGPMATPLQTQEQKLKLKNVLGALTLLLFSGGEKGKI